MNPPIHIPQTSSVILKPEDFDSVTNTELAACLITLGFPLDGQGFSRVIGDGISAPGGSVTWRFQKRSRDGKYELGYVLAKWNDFAWLQSNTDDPLAYIITAFHNRRRLIDQVKQGCTLALVRQGMRYALFPKNCERAMMENVGRFMGF